MRRVMLLAFCLLGTVAASRPAAPGAEATFPGFNGRIVFTTDTDGNEELYSMNPDGSSLTRLTNNPATDRFPAVSADGAKIAFASNRDGDHEIFVMNSDGSGLTQLTDNTTFETAPAWSPDGSKIAFHTTRDGNTEVYVMGVDGANQQNITNLPSHEFDADWSPDGSAIAFGSTRDGASAIFLMDVDGGNQRKVVDGGSASWSPDGSRLALETTAGGADAEAAVVNRDGAGLEIVTGNDLHDYGPVFSPDGRYLLVDRLDEGLDTFWLIPLSGGAEVPLPAPGIFNGFADWAPLIAKAGDADCDEDVDAVDALQVLRSVAGMPTADCVGAGNVKCADAIDTVDALFILRHVAGLPVTLPQGCPEIGTQEEGTP